ncbi:YbaB/EbfC family nucleoid-associated protein [Oscillospiraceae bacterium MB08-C2-2]|nr:YbaB/EbfC family nucleoid-associated protein [Oscillospiraceae bacterium MB08-C2-2]
MKARLPQGMGGGAQNMNAMIKQAQKMQTLIGEKQEELNTREFTETVGGGAVEVIMTGDKRVKTVTIKPEVIDPEDVDMLQDLIVAAMNQALATVEEVTSAEMEKITGGMNMPGMF